MPDCIPGQVAAAIAEAADLLDASGAGWVLGGSAGLALRGIALPSPPRDVDLYVDPEEAAAAHRALAAYAVDEQQRSETDIYRSILSHYVIGGVQLELVGGFVVRAKNCEYRTEVRGVLLPCAWRAELDGRRVPVAPLAHELWFNTLREREDRALLVAAAMRGLSAHDAALREIEARNRLDASVKEAVHARIGAGAQREGDSRR